MADYWGTSWNPTTIQPQQSTQQKVNPAQQQMISNVQSGANFTPYQNQLNKLLTDPTSIQQTPGYQFALDQGNQAINRSAAAKGMLNSGNVLAELAKYGQGMASQEYGNQVNTLAKLMQGSQDFGVNAGYYRPQAPTGSQWVGGAQVNYLPQPGYFNQV